MRHFQPTVRQLPPLGRGYHSASIMSEPLDASAREVETRSPDRSTGARSLPLAALAHRSRSPDRLSAPPGSATRR